MPSVCRVAVAGRLEGGEPLEQRGEDDACLDAGQCRAEAGVSAAAEGEVGVGIAGHVEAVRIGEHLLVAVRRAEQQDQHPARTHRPAADLDVVTDHPGGALDR